MGRRCSRRRRRIRGPFTEFVARIPRRGRLEVRRLARDRVRRRPCLRSRSPVGVEGRLHAVLVPGCRWRRRWWCLRRGGLLALLSRHGIERIDGRCCDRHRVAVDCLRWWSSRCTGAGLGCLRDRSCWREYIRHRRGMNRRYAGRMAGRWVRRRVHGVRITSGVQRRRRERPRRRRLCSRLRSDWWRLRRRRRGRCIYPGRTDKPEYCQSVPVKPTFLAQSLYSWPSWRRSHARSYLECNGRSSGHLR